MIFSRLNRKLLGWLGRPLEAAHSPAQPHRGPQAHVIILDGTMSSLEPGYETHAGLLYKMLSSSPSNVTVYYESGVQWPNWKSTLNVMMGRGINRQIRRAYGYLASRYRPGDRIYLFGYSRGAYAVRSLAGVIDRVGLLQSVHATERNITTAYRHYECTPDSTFARAFHNAYCHTNTPIEMVGAWDTVKALGLRLPFLWRFSEARHSFHNHELGASIRNGFHALALDETREVYEPVLWNCPDGFLGRVEQVWFRGTHGDIGGQLNGFDAARPLANLSLVWMLDKARLCGLPLPEDAEAQFTSDAAAPSVGTWRGWGKIFLLRKRRRALRSPSERLHSSVPVAQAPPPRRLTALWLRRAH